MRRIRWRGSSFSGGGATFLAQVFLGFVICPHPCDKPPLDFEEGSFLNPPLERLTTNPLHTLRAECAAGKEDANKTPKV
ncbi:hypothetical protein M407DRAFT_196348 [Tulasnella calospora MUT 4182]|uniref:Secreted protein n=1 Tax=Tulasnella calospora MUT 4182 TaxID=1051891 RepID=A0A0C3QKJ1_9AGAM|nr:hypothetical protein M407DRAFT_196348 [Tulasnella calospora MUT 4182]